MRIGYYAHHHGSGHCRQADKLAALLPASSCKNFIVFTSLALDAYAFNTVAKSQIVRLNPEDEREDDVLLGRAGQHWQPASLHYSPVGNSDIQTRSWQILNAIQEHDIDLMIIDVSVEVAMLCRAASVPYLYVRLAGIRDDTPHLNAFAGALGLLAPYPKTLEAAETNDWLKQKTLYLDFLPDKNSKSISYNEFIASFANLTDDNERNKVSSKLTRQFNISENSKQKPKIITVIKGYGGHEAIDAKLPELRAMQLKALIISLGPIADDKRAYVDIATQVVDVSPFLMHSDLLIMACGLNGIAQAYHHETPLVVLPDERPHREQEVMAAALIAQGRALSWQQFVEQSNSTQNTDSLLTLSAKPDIYQTRNNLNIKIAAQALMDSFIDYTATKSWFEKWLLPQLNLTPERINNKNKL
ncbi:hypothetical protein ACS8E3_09205 [Psychrobacter sp. 2Y5]|uniref:hypothetical protein n=1 Tax=unclassified Psychrobacter TaxID=196806 RepID=UPI003F4582FC